MPHQVAVTVIAPVKDGHDEELARLLERIGAEPDTIPFSKLADVHFGRLFVLEPTQDLEGDRIRSQLVLLSDVDAPVARFLPALVDAFGPLLDAILGHCDGYPTGENVTRDDRVAYLQHRRVEAAAAYTNTVGRSAEQIRQEAALHSAIEDFLDRPDRDWSDATAEDVRTAVRDFVFGTESLRWAREPMRAPQLAWRVKELAHAILAPLVLLVLLPLIVILLPVWAVLLRIHERSDTPERARPDPERVALLTATEDHVVQNPFTAVGLLKRGTFRRVTFEAVLGAVSYGVRHIYNRGRLSGIRTIHFARWVFIDGKRRLFFASNYDGSQESYMDDFIDKVAWGLNAVFSNGVGYPRTNWLVRDGAKDEVSFKSYLRVHQVLTPVWYSAYPDLTATNIENNARIRAGLYGAMTSEQAAEWVRRL
jgi:hypothetical protein